MVTETRLRRSRLGQTDLNFLHVPLQDVSYKFYFGIKPSYLTKFGERGMPTSMTMDSRLRMFSSLKTVEYSNFKPLFDNLRDEIRLGSFNKVCSIQTKQQLLLKGHGLVQHG
jgi:hypothetical protein